MPESNIESTASKDNSTSQQEKINNAAQSWQNAPIQQDTSFQNAFAKVMQSNYVKENLLPGEEVIYRGRVTIVTQIPLIILTLFFIFPIIFIFINLYSTELALTNKRVIAKKGYIRKESIELPFKRIDSIMVQQGAFGRIFNYGTVIINGSSISMPMKFISNPIEFRNQVARQINKEDD